MTPPTLLALLTLLTMAAAWENCTDLTFGAFNEPVCITVLLDDGVFSASLRLGEKTLGPVALDLAELSEDALSLGPKEGCIGVGLPGAKACVRVDNLAVRLHEPRHLSGCVQVSGKLLGRVVATRDIGCVNLTGAPEHGDL